jgi:hypothetical protein
VGSRAVLDVVVKRKIPSPRRESNPRTPIVQPVVHKYFTELGASFSSENIRVRGKIVPVLYLTEQHDVKAYWGMEV